MSSCSHFGCQQRGFGCNLEGSVGDVAAHRSADYDKVIAERNELQHYFDTVCIERDALRARAERYRELLQDVRDIAFDGDGLNSARELGQDIANFIDRALSEDGGKEA